ncbi:hypothetical protein B0A48_04610 [Cryoendolithus antarcticus]|uniref:Uncharacterized protein n=1 Tax=Cryoendolithus antarcticus TaxID=1507870 RepID=A0A1V8TGB6_9PEZI|nr:hypothetical protein B0A48_04610 [Cryoendolithus antarcticus]
MCRLPWHTVRIDSPVDREVVPPEIITSHADWDAYLASYPLNKVQDMPSYHAARKEAYRHTIFRARIDTTQNICYRQFTGPMFAPGQGMKTATEIARQAECLAVRVKLADHKIQRAFVGVKRVLAMCKGAKIVEIEVEFDVRDERRAEVFKRDLVKARESGLWQGVSVYVKLSGREGLYEDWHGRACRVMTRA